MASMSDTGFRIDLYSDTKSRPSPQMLDAMARARCGDEQQGEDPTVAELNAKVATLLGKEAALFLPSGTMANLVSILVHCERGDEILAERSSHVLHFETGGASALAGAVLTAIDGDRGMFSAEDLARHLRPRRWNSPRSRMIWIEQTTNLGGGAVWPLGTLQSLWALAQSEGLILHIDGARLLNAAVAAGVDPKAYGSLCDTLWLDFTKGLGAPFGAVLAGSNDFIGRARRFKHMLGGAMRQAGVMAGACLYALDHNLSRLAVDHANAGLLHQGLSTLPWLRPLAEPQTNIIVAKLDTGLVQAGRLSGCLAEKGIRVSVFGADMIRMVTHLDISQSDIEETIDAFQGIRF